MKCILFTMLVVFSSSCYSATTSSGKITTLMNAYGGWIFNAQMDQGNPDSCAKATFILPSDHAQYDELYSFLLTAYTTGQPITIYTGGCDINGYIVVTNFYSSWGN